MKTTIVIVNCLVRYYQVETGETSENLLSKEINDLVKQMGEFLAERLEEDAPHKVI